MKKMILALVLLGYAAFGGLGTKIDEIISYISRYFTLKTGDIIYTGCPSGCGPVHINDHLEGFIEERKVLDFNCK